MTNIERLLDDSPNSRTRALLLAGCSEVPPARFSQQLLASLGAATAVGAATSGVAASLSTGTKVGGFISGAASSSVAAPSLALMAAKWVAVGVLGGGILAAGTEAAFAPRAVPSRAPRVTKIGEMNPVAPNVNIAPQRTVAPVAPVVSSPPSASSARAPHATAPAVASETRSGALRNEVAIIDRVRRALASGNTSLALSELDGFARTSTTGVFDREARVLRIQSLRDAGDVAGARKLADQYLLDFPGDAHAVRLRAQDASPQPSEIDSRTRRRDRAGR
jgi:hypothetical protein